MQRKNKRKNENKQDNSNFIAFASISLGVLSYVLCCVRVVGMVFAILAILLAVCAIIDSKKKLFPIISLLVAIIGLAFNLAMLSAVSDFLMTFSQNNDYY